MEKAMKKLSLLYCVAAMLLSACANDPTETPQIDTRAVVFEASNHTDESRTAISDLKILWQSNDAVGLFSPQIGAAKNNRIVVEDQYAGKPQAVLKSDLRYANNTDDHTFYAYYPYAEGQTDYTRVEGTIATTARSANRPLCGPRRRSSRRIHPWGCNSNTLSPISTYRWAREVCTPVRRSRRSV